MSATAEHLTRAELRGLLDQGGKDSDAADITGLLLYRDGRFLQFLEGEQDRVESRFAAIQRDDRYRDVVVVRRRDQPGRQFPNWTMAFGDVDPTSNDPVSVEMPPPEGPAPQTQTEAAFILDLLDLFDA